MSYFDVVYADHELSPRAKTVCMYLHDRANKEGESPWRSCSPGARREKTTVSKKRWLYIQPLSAAVKKSASPAKGGLRSLTGPGAGSSWPTQKAQ